MKETVDIGDHSFNFRIREKILHHVIAKKPHFAQIIPEL